MWQAFTCAPVDRTRMFPFARNTIPVLKGDLDKSFLTFLDRQKNGDSRAQNGDFVRGVVSKGPITGRISKRGSDAPTPAGIFDKCSAKPNRGERSESARCASHGPPLLMRGHRGRRRRRRKLSDTVYAFIYDRNWPHSCLPA